MLVSQSGHVIIVLIQFKVQNEGLSYFNFPYGGYDTSTSYPTYQSPKE